MDTTTGADEGSAVAGWATAGDDNSTNAIGSSGVHPGQLLASIETCPSPIGDSLDMLIKSCDFLELASSSVFDIHRIIDTAV